MPGEQERSYNTFICFMIINKSHTNEDIDLMHLTPGTCSMISELFGHLPENFLLSQDSIYRNILHININIFIRS